MKRVLLCEPDAPLRVKLRGAIERYAESHGVSNVEVIIAPNANVLGKALLQYGATEGYPPFVESLKIYVGDQLGIDIPAVLPVTGSTQAMDLLCKALIDPGDTVLVENPSFLGNLQCLKLYQANLVALQSDEQGLIPEDLEKKIRQYHPKLLYTIPTFQNPTGKTLPEERRKAVAELANQYGMVDHPLKCTLANQIQFPHSRYYHCLL